MVKGKYFTGGDCMEKIVRQSLLYDFYGELLTEHQKAIYEDVVNNDMSYSEIARMNQISRQGVYDMIKRCDKILEEYEDKLQLVDKFMKARKQVEKMKDCISELMEENQDDRLNLKIEAIDRLSDRILDEF
ncbi:DNA-binding protein [Clostridium sp. OM05-9]|nr:DNA-binding protein [Clostridium sp. OM05-9]